MKFALAAFLFLALPAFATISQRQAPVSHWNSGSATSCSANLSSTYYSAGDLIVVWTYWTSSGTLTASVSDTPYANKYVSAVGPTLQSAASPPITSQIFYAANTSTSGGPGNDVVTVQYSGSASTSGCVFVEYQGADQSYPLDSVSAGYSTSGNPTALLDSGAVAPANSNLLLFGGGTWDQGSLIAGGNFTAIQSNGGSITEQEIVSGNNTLQRATAIPNPAPSGSGGNWVMQMAIFRDASWTVGGGWTPVRPFQVLDASQFPGVDIGTKINNAYAALPSTGGSGTIIVPPGTYSYTNPIVLAAPGRAVLLHCEPGSTFLNYTGSSGTAITLAYSGQGFALPTQQYSGHGIDGCVFTGPGNTSSTIGLEVNGGTSSVVGVNGATLSLTSGSPFSTSWSNVIISLSGDSSQSFPTNFYTIASCASTSVCTLTSPISGGPYSGVTFAQGGTIGATIQRSGFRDFGTGIDFANQGLGTFLTTFRDGYITGNGKGVNVAFNNQERNVFEHVCICNSMVGVYFATGVGGGDYTFRDDHFDFNTQYDFETIAGGISLKIDIDNPHFENSNTVAPTVGNITGGDIAIRGGRMQDDSPSGSPAEMWLLNDTGTANISAQELNIASNTPIAAVFSLTAISGHNVSAQIGPGIVTPTGISSLVATSGAAFASILTTNKFQIQLGGGLPTTLTTAGASITTLGSGGGGSGISLTPGSAGVTVNGSLNVTGTKNFKIDDPLDPANKYIYHSAVESSEMMNIYAGDVTTDANGVATVQLPAWFQALNGNFRYQLTSLGQFAQAMVANEIDDGEFSIKTDKPNVKVSWQVTAVRKDAYAKAHPLVVVQDKPAAERGYYLHPELFGAPPSKGISSRIAGETRSGRPAEDIEAAKP